MRSTLIVFMLGIITIGLLFWSSNPAEPVPADREEVVLWHFWGGKDLEVVRDTISRFNASQTKYWAREISMPGNNLQAKLFLSIAGGSPPDLVNQDDAILADWTHSRLIVPMTEVAPESEVAAVENFLLPAAKKLSLVDGQMMAVCNGLDIRALFFNQTALEKFGCKPPADLSELDSISEKITPPGKNRDRQFYAFLPDSRRLWAWAVVFGGKFTGPESTKFDFSQDAVANALKWMQSYSGKYGWDNIAAFRQSDQSLPGKAFPLLPVTDEETIGRYVMLMDGQWRVRDLEEFTRQRRTRGASEVEFGVCPLPAPPGGREQAGWANGNFFVVPRGARHKEGAWELIKFWIGYNKPDEAVKTCQNGGWIPVSGQIVNHPAYQEFLGLHPLMETFVTMAQSDDQIPFPVTRGSDQLRRLIDKVAYQAMTDPTLDAKVLLKRAESQATELRSAGSN